MDRAYLDYRRLRRFTIAGAFFVTRAKRNLRCTIRDVRPVDRTTGLRSDHTIVLNGIKTATLYPESLRRRAFYDVEHKRRIVFITNNFAIPALTIAVSTSAAGKSSYFSSGSSNTFVLKPSSERAIMR